MISRSNLKYLPFRRGPTNPILTSLSQPNWVQNVEEWGDQLHLPIMHGFDEGNILLTGVVWKLHLVYDRGFLKACNAKQHQESFLQSHISSPHIKPLPPNVFLTLIVVVKLAQKENGKTERERVGWWQAETKI